MDSDDKKINPTRLRFVNYLIDRGVGYIFDASEISRRLNIKDAGSLLEIAWEYKIISRCDEEGKYRLKNRKNHFASPYMQSFLKLDPVYRPPSSESNHRKKLPKRHRSNSALYQDVYQKLLAASRGETRRTKGHIYVRPRSTKPNRKNSSGKYIFEKSKKYKSIAGTMSVKREVDADKYKYTDKSALGLWEDLEEAKKFRDFYGTDH